jgi:Flp pilus assembly protein TadD
MNYVKENNTFSLFKRGDMNQSVPVLRYTRVLLPLLLSACTTQTPPPLDTRILAYNTSQNFSTSLTKESPESLLNVLDPEVTTLEKAFEKAKIAEEEGKTDRALFYYVKALQFEAKNTQALLHIAALHEHNNKPELALKIYQDILSIDKNNIIANENLGLNYLSHRVQPQAQQYLTLVVSQDESRWKAQNGLGILADLEKKYNVAIAHYQKALAVNPSSPMLLNNLGYSYYSKGDEKTARQYFNQALSFDGKYQRALYNLALIEIKHQQYSTAISLFNQIMPLHESYNNVGYIAMLNAQYSVAENYFRKAIEESPIYFPQAEENLEQLKILLTPKT